MARLKVNYRDGGLPSQEPEPSRTDETQAAPPPSPLPIQAETAGAFQSSPPSHLSPAPDPSTLIAPEPEPEPKSEGGPSASASSPASDAPDFVAIARSVGEPIGGGAIAVKTLLSQAEFRQLFVGMFDVAHAVTELKSLKVTETPAAAGAADALYRIAQRVPSLRWLIAPEAEWARDGMAISVFVIPVTRGVLAELQDRARSRAGGAARPVVSRGPGGIDPAAVINGA